MDGMQLEQSNSPHNASTMTVVDYEKSAVTLCY